MLKIQQTFSQGDLKRGNSKMTTNTITARRKGNPQHMLREQKI
jgi:hypothetical protein